MTVLIEIPKTVLEVATAIDVTTYCGYAQEEGLLRKNCVACESEKLETGRRVGLRGQSVERFRKHRNE